MINRTQRVVCICSLSLLLIACSGNNDDLVRYINEAKHRKTREIEPIPSFAPLPTFKFPDNGNRRNPFKPITQKRKRLILMPRIKIGRKSLWKLILWML